MEQFFGQIRVERDRERKKETHKNGSKQTFEQT